VTRIKKTSLYLAIGSLISLIIVPVLGVRTARAAGPDGTRQRRAKRMPVSAGLGLALILGMLVVPIAAVAGNAPAADAATVPSSQGTDFWLTFQSNCTVNCNGSGGTLFLFISGSTATTGTVSDSAVSFSQAFTVTPGTTTEISVPGGAEIDSINGTVAGGALHVTAGAPVSAYGLNTEPYTTDGFLGLPTPILGTSYIAEGYENDSGFGGSDLAVVGTQNDTTVTITPTESTEGYPAGVPFTETLNQGDVFQLIDADGDSSGGDLSGTTITSSEPVAVFAGDDCADVPETDYACNTLAEEMTPVDTWGTDFLTEPLATRSGDTFRVMASENHTTVDIDGAPVATLSAGQFYETILSSASTITTNNPVQLMQYSNSSSYDDADADPFDITIPPTEQFLNSYTVATEPDGADPAITQNYLNIVAPTSEVSSISLDGSDLPSSDFSPIAGSSYSGAQVAVDFGSHTVSATLPFGLSVYGDGGYDGYGYPGGFTLSPIATVASVSLAPASPLDTVGSSQCETATVTDSNGNPVSGVQVNFTVTGPNPNTGFAYSAADGTAQYCYTGTAAGADTEKAAVGNITSNTATITWTLPPTSLSTSLSGGGQSGTSISVPSAAAVTDSATLSGTNAASATGTVTYNVYSDSACTDLAQGGTPETITNPGTLPASAPVTLSTPGTYYWGVSYSGDSKNESSASTCGAAGEIETVGSSPQPASLSTSLSGGGQSGTAITVPAKTAVTDSATLSGTNAAAATGTVTYNVYSDSACTDLAQGGTPETITTPGTLPSSAPVSLSSAGTYYWQAAYSGDPNNQSSTSTCGSETETVQAGTTPQRTKIKTMLIGSGSWSGHKCWWQGDVITVFAGAQVSDSATLSGANAAEATGTVTYAVYAWERVKKNGKWGWSWVAVANAGTVTVTDGHVPNSNPVTLPVGTYEWQASYSGNANNQPESNYFGSETEVVIPMPPKCKQWQWGFDPGCKLVNKH
jgi:hypothetical protein